MTASWLRRLWPAELDRPADSDFPSPERVAHFWQQVISLTDAPRANVTKAFDYAGKEHFDRHKDAVNRGVRYRWLMYCADFGEYTEVLELWNDYMSVISPPEPGTVEVRILCVPLQAQIPYRVSIVGPEICIFSPEPSRGTYSQSTTIEASANGRKIAEAFDSLWQTCLPIEQAADLGKRALTGDARSQIDEHEILRGEVLRTFVRDLPQVLTIAHAEHAGAVLVRTLEMTRTNMGLQRVLVLCTVGSLATAAIALLLHFV